MVFLNSQKVLDLLSLVKISYENFVSVILNFCPPHFSDIADIQPKLLTSQLTADNMKLLTSVSDPRLYNMLTWRLLAEF